MQHNDLAHKKEKLLAPIDILELIMEIDRIEKTGQLASLSNTTRRRIFCEPSVWLGFFSVLDELNLGDDINRAWLMHSEETGHSAAIIGVLKELRKANISVALDDYKHLLVLESFQLCSLQVGAQTLQPFTRKRYEVLIWLIAKTGISDAAAVDIILWMEKHP